MHIKTAYTSYWTPFNDVNSNIDNRTYMIFLWLSIGCHEVVSFSTWFLSSHRVKKQINRDIIYNGSSTKNTLYFLLDIDLHICYKPEFLIANSFSSKVSLRKVTMSLDISYIVPLPIIAGISFFFKSINTILNRLSYVAYSN